MGNKNRSRVDEWLTEEKLMLLECWARDGYLVKDFLARMGVSKVVFYRWLDQYPQLRKAIYKGKEIVDYQVENALLKSALGYTTRETKIIRSNKPDKDGNFTLRTEITEKEVAPNTTAIAIWLNNRKPDQWKRNRDNVFELKDSDSNITVNIYKNGNSKDEEKDDESWDDSETIKEKLDNELDSNIIQEEQEQYEDAYSQYADEGKPIKKGTLKRKKVEYTPEELEWLGEE